MDDGTENKFTGHDFAWGMLIAVLVAEGGSYELDLWQTETDALGNKLGEFYAVALDQVNKGRVRLSVVAKDTLPPEA